jgi:hypothetical protein
MPFEQFRRTYRGGGGSGFGGNAWTSLMGGAAQGLLSAQKNRAELVKQAQEDALRRASENRAQDSAKREQERLDMARETQEAASKKRLRDEEDRQRDLRKEREEAARQREISEQLLTDWAADDEIAGYWSESERMAMAPLVASGDLSPGKVRPPKIGQAKVTYSATPEASRRDNAQIELSAWDERFFPSTEVGPHAPVAAALGDQAQWDPSMGESAGGAGTTRLPPAQGNAIFDQSGQVVTNKLEGYVTKLIPELQQKIAQQQQIVAVAKPGSQEAYEAKRKIEQYGELIEEAHRRIREAQRRQSGDFAPGGDNPYANVSTAIGRNE